VVVFVQAKTPAALTTTCNSWANTSTLILTVLKQALALTEVVVGEHTKDPTKVYCSTTLVELEAQEEIKVLGGQGLQITSRTMHHC
jgi:hypothetical protein